MKELITEKIKSKGKLNADDMSSMFLDITVTSAKELISRIDILNDIEDQECLFALQELKNWDYKLDINSRAAAIYEVFKYELIKAVLKPSLGNELTEKIMGVGYDPELKIDSKKIFSYL